ncbi:phosphatidylserine lipase ABHD16A [Maniola hyperantus]|uniref:phosphatidylserine lipase ABHD16A n=1 Tax=Aphantopus hyperantus TaxID=2795564 RepID=UPI001569ABBF|nr:phosphatidylserine lipase ABHD16A [Maniola hyperantus]
MIKLLLRCLFSPRLYRIYGQGPGEGIYEPKRTEKFADKIISVVHTIANIGMYTSPIICMYIYKRGFFSWEEINFLAYLFGSISFSYLVRAFGRASNPTYVEFINTLDRPVEDRKAYFESLRKYDFEFNVWPTTFKMPPTSSSSWLENKPFSKCANPDLPYYHRVTIQLLAYIASHTFALRLIYPGTIGIIQNMLWIPLFEGRTYLVDTFNGKRAKILTADRNTIDTMFVDNRLDSPKGKTLVICCEGNTGFYEIGIMTTPIKAGYSTLGWNHPGFGGSTGLPFPRQEQHAIDAVVQYAINDLDFDVENIVMYGWSIGGYPAAWAAVNYPDIKGLILDASFDDLLPLAWNQMPQSWTLLVKEVVRSFVNLNISELLNKYSGPVQLVRRTEDEVICLRPGQLSTNRGNNLLINLLEKRHPYILEDDIMEKVKACTALSDQQRIVLSRENIPDDKRKILQLISKYLRDFRSTHCTLLPEDIFDAVMGSINNSK